MRWGGLIGMLSLAVALDAQQPVRVSAPNFEIYTAGPEAAARAVLLHLESVRALFQGGDGLFRLPAGRVRIVAFRSLEEYRSYSPLPFATAHYQSAPDRDTIVMAGLATNQYPAAVHEFVHLLQHESKLDFPLWLAEGLPELYSTLKPLGGGKYRLGEPPPGHARVAGGPGGAALTSLFEVNRTSPEYRNPESAPLFYARSWALTHMLAIYDSYRAGFPGFLRLLAGGAEPAPAMEGAFGRPLKRIQEDLVRYAGQARYPAVEVAAPAAPAEARTDSTPVTAFDWRMVLAELEAGLSDAPEGMRRAYDRVAQEFPGRPEPLVTLGRMALRRGAVEEARLQLGRAIEAGCSDALVYLEYADLMAGREAGGERIRLLRRALELRPEDAGIQFRLAMALYEAFEYEEARERMLRIAQAPENRSSEFHRVLAYLDDRLGYPAEARKEAERSLASAATPEDRDSAGKLIEFLSRPPFQVAPVETGVSTPIPIEMPEPSPKPQPDSAPGRPATPLYAVQGELVQIDCLGWTSRLWIRTARERLAFQIEEGGELVIRRGGAPVLRYFACGTQKSQAATVRYEMRRNARLQTQGVVRELLLR